MGTKCVCGALVKESGYRPFWERVEGQDGALDLGSLSARVEDWDQVTEQKWDDRPFTRNEAGLIKKELRSLIRRRSPNCSVDETEVIRLFDQIRDAAITLELALEEKRILIAPRHDFRPALRNLKNHPGRLQRIFGVNPGDTPRRVYDRQRRREDKDLRKLLIFGKTLIDRDLDGDLYTRLQSSPQLRTEVIDALLAHPLLSDRAGRNSDQAIDEYLTALKSVYRSASGREAGRSISSHVSKPENQDVSKSGKPGGPAVRFMRTCLQPFDPGITDGAIAERIRKPRRRVKERKT